MLCRYIAKLKLFNDLCKVFHAEKAKRATDYVEVAESLQDLPTPVSAPTPKAGTAAPMLQDFMTRSSQAPH